LWDEIDEYTGLARHGAVGVAADLRNLGSRLLHASSAFKSWLASVACLRS
jgi:hypothetical protein